MTENLLNLIEYDDEQDEESPALLTHSPYIEFQTLVNILQSKTGIFTLLSLNCQSINAKFSELKIYI